MTNGRQWMLPATIERNLDNRDCGAITTIAIARVVETLPVYTLRSQSRNYRAAARAVPPQMEKKRSRKNIT